MYNLPSLVLSANSPKSKLLVVGIAPAVAERLNLMFVFLANFGSFFQSLYKEVYKLFIIIYLY